MTKDIDPPLDLYIKAIMGRKALNVVALDVAEMTSYADVFIFCSGRSNRGPRISISNPLRTCCRFG